MRAEVEDLVARAGAVVAALALPELQDKLPSVTYREHNLRAQVLRNGLVILAFAGLEDFLRRRVHSAVTQIATGPLAFSDLPEGLREAATISVGEALPTAMRAWRNLGLDAEVEVRRVCSDVASTAGKPYAFAPLLFGHQRSNLNEGDVAHAVGCLNVDGGWTSIGQVAARAGVYPVPVGMKGEFERFARARHIAAHNAGATTQPTDLEQFVKLIFAIGVAVDCLVSLSAARLRAGDPNFTVGKQRTKAADVRLRFVRMRKDGRWEDRREGAQRASGTHVDQAGAVATALARSPGQSETILVLGSALTPLGWYTP